MSTVTRRDFLRGTASLAALAAAGTVSKGQTPAQPAQGPAPRGPNERINVACIGVRGQGYGHVQGYAGRHNCHVTYICDVDQAPAIVGRAAQTAERAQGAAPRVVVVPRGADMETHDPILVEDRLARPADPR